MTDQQILTLAIAIVFPLATVISSNSHVGDVNKRIDDLRSDLGHRIDDSKAELLRHLNGIESDLKEFFRIQADLDKRVQRLEDKK